MMDVLLALDEALMKVMYLGMKMVVRWEHF
jgi:hypothetical protein